MNELVSYGCCYIALAMTIANNVGMATFAVRRPASDLIIAEDEVQAKTAADFVIGLR